MELNIKEDRVEEPNESPFTICLKIEQREAKEGDYHPSHNESHESEKRATKLLTATVLSSQHFFSADSKTTNIENIRIESIIEEEIVFRYKYFFEFLLYHVLFYIFLGK